MLGSLLSTDPLCHLRILAIMMIGTKFNCRMEDVPGETYLGLRIFRFYYRCTACAGEFSMKTDPKSTDYILEEVRGHACLQGVLVLSTRFCLHAVWL